MTQESKAGSAGPDDDLYKPEKLGKQNLKTLSWTCRTEKIGRFLSGPCPHCGHLTDAFFPKDVYAGFREDLAVKPQAGECEEALLPITCGCMTQHDPKGEESGCGRSWDGAW